MPRPCGLIVRSLWRHPSLHDKQDLHKNVRTLLNKITPTTFDELCEEFVAMEVFRSEAKVRDVTKILFDKAVEDHMYCPMYSNLCSKQAMDELSLIGTTRFRDHILALCFNSFIQSAHENRIKNEAFPRACEEDNEAYLVRRHRMFGNITFVAELFKAGIISSNDINSLISHLLSDDNQTKLNKFEGIECALRLLEAVLRYIDCDQERRMEHSDLNAELYFNYLKDLALKRDLPNRIRLLILNLVERRKDGWRNYGTDRQPKKISEIRNEWSIEVSSVQRRKSRKRPKRRDFDE